MSITAWRGDSKWYDDADPLAWATALPAGPFRETVERDAARDAAYNGQPMIARTFASSCNHRTGQPAIGERRPPINFSAGRSCLPWPGRQPQRSSQPSQRYNWQLSPCLCRPRRVQREAVNFTPIAIGDDRKGRGVVPCLRRRRLVVPGCRCCAIAGLVGPGRPS